MRPEAETQQEGRMKYAQVNLHFTDGDVLRGYTSTMRLRYCEPPWPH